MANVDDILVDILLYDVNKFYSSSNPVSNDFYIVTEDVNSNMILTIYDQKPKIILYLAHIIEQLGSNNYLMRLGTKNKLDWATNITLEVEKIADTLYVLKEDHTSAGVRLLAGTYLLKANMKTKKED